jgi:hypothetical protein
MPLSGKGMLITVMDADPAEEEDFNKWYDREHIVERVAIAGFLEARRYVVSQVPELIQHGEARDPGQSSLSRQVAKCDAVDQASQFEIPQLHARSRAGNGEQRSGTWRHARLQPHSPVGIKPKRVAKSHPGAIRFGRWSRPGHLHAPA